MPDNQPERVYEEMPPRVAGETPWGKLGMTREEWLAASMPRTLEEQDDDSV